MTENGFSYRAELGRKAIHLLALVVPFLMLTVDRTICLTIFIPLSGFALTLEVLRAKHHGVANFIENVFGRWMRPGEANQVGGSITLNGATWIMLSATLLTLIWLIPLEISAISLGMFMVGDAAAALIGRRFGRVILWPGPKTLEGSLAFFAAAALLIIPFHPTISWPIGLLAAGTAALLEWLPLPINDNLRVPLFVAVIITLLEQSPISFIG